MLWIMYRPASSMALFFGYLVDDFFSGSGHIETKLDVHWRPKASNLKNKRVNALRCQNVFSFLQDMFKKKRILFCQGG